MHVLHRRRRRLAAGARLAQLALVTLTVPLAGSVLTVCTRAQSPPGEVRSYTLITDDVSNFPNLLDIQDCFGGDPTVLGDLDGDGFVEVAVGANQDDTDGGAAGLVYILSLRPDGTVQAVETVGLGVAGDKFGVSTSRLGDADGDTLADLLIGSPFQNGVGTNWPGAVWIATLDLSDGTDIVQDFRKYDSGGGPTGIPGLENGDGFGISVAGLGDFDDNGFVDFGAGAMADDDGGTDRGAVHLVYLKDSLKVDIVQKISSTQGNFTAAGGALDDGDWFGVALATLGDLDGDDVIDLAVGASEDDDGGTSGSASSTGAVWILFMNADGTVKLARKISATTGGFTGQLDDGDRFGLGLDEIGDVNGDGVVDLAVKALGDDDGGTAGQDSNVGAVWILFLDEGGRVKGHQKISKTEGGFDEPLMDRSGFGEGGALGDLDGDGRVDLLVGAPGPSAASTVTGSLYVLFLQGPADQAPEGSPVASIDGRAGRATIGLTPKGSNVGPGDEFIPKPFVVVPVPTQDVVEVKVSEVSPENTSKVAFQAPPPSVGSQFPTQGQPVMASQDDFNGDGGDDAITANVAGNSISYLESDPDPGDPLFEPQVALSLLPQNQAPVAVLAFDYDANALRDIVTAGKFGVSVFPATAPGAFGAPAFTPVNAPNPSLHTDIAVGDLDADAVDEVVTTSGSLAPSGFITVLDKTGSALAVTSTIPIGQPVASVLMAQFNGTGAEDVLVAMHDDATPGPGDLPRSTLKLYTGNAGALSFSADVYSVTDPDGIVPKYGTTGDIDNDGDIDAVYTSGDTLAYDPAIFAAEFPPVVVTLLLNNGSGVFSVTTIPTSYVGKGVVPQLLDLAPTPPEAGGPFLDLVLLWYSDANVGLGAEVADHSYVAALLWDDELKTFVDASPNQFLTGPEPGNGDAGELDTAALSMGAGIDLVVPNCTPVPDVSGSLSVLGIDGLGVLTTQSVVTGVSDLNPDMTHPGGVWEGGPVDAQLIDVNGDGHLDAVIYTEWNDKSPLPTAVPASLSLFIGDGQGGFPFPRADYFSLTRGGEIALEHIDANPYGDAVVTQRKPLITADDTVRLYGGAANGHLVHAGTITMQNQRRLTGGLALADVDGSTVPDIITTATAAGVDGLLVIRNITTGSLHTFFPMPTSWTEVRSVLMADIVGTGGHLDAVVGTDDGRLVVMAGDGAGGFSFSPVGAQAAELGGGAVALADLTGDGRADLISASRSFSGTIDQAYVRRLRGKLGGTFEVSVVEGLSSVGLSGSLRPLLADFDDDGATDTALVHGGAAGTVSVLINPLGDFEVTSPGKAGPDGIVPTLEGRGYTTPSGWVELRVGNAPGGGVGMLVMQGVDPADLDGYWSAGVGTGGLLQFDGEPGVPGAGSAVAEATIPADPALIGLSFSFRVFVSGPLIGIGTGAAPGAADTRGRPAVGPAGTSATSLSGSKPGPGAKAPVATPSTNALRMTIVDGQ